MENPQPCSALLVSELSRRLFGGIEGCSCPRERGDEKVSTAAVKILVPADPCVEGLQILLLVSAPQPQMKRKEIKLQGTMLSI